MPAVGKGDANPSGTNRSRWKLPSLSEGAHTRDEGKIQRSSGSSIRRTLPREIICPALERFLSSMDELSQDTDGTL